MAEVKMPHPGHEQHLCLLSNIRYVRTNLEEYKKLVQNAKFMCRDCGRVASSEKNLCNPERL